MNPITDKNKTISPERNVEDFLAQPGVREKVNSIAKRLGVMPEELLYAIGKETGGSYSSAQRNLGGGKAVGLIQFYPDYNKELGKSETFKTIRGKKYEITDLEKMTELQQLDVVEEYLIENFKGRGGKPGELYVSIGYPGLVGKSPDTKITGENLERIKLENPGWVDENGNVTKEKLMSFGGSKPEFAQYTPSTTTDVNFENKAQNETYANISEKIDNSFYSDKEKQLLKEKLKKDLEGKTDVQDLTSLIENYNLEDEVLGIDGISTMKVDESISNMQTILDDPNATLKQKQEASEIINELKVKDLEINTYSPGSREEVNAINEKALSTEKAKEIFEKYKPKQDTKLLDKEEPKFFTGPDGKQYPYSKVEPGTEDTITTEGLLQQGQGPEVDLSSAKGLDVIAPSYETPEKTPLGQKIKNFFKKDGDGEGLKNALSSLKNSADEAFFALSAGAGIMSVYEATRRDKVTKSHVDPLFKEALLKTREAAQTGMPYEQRQAALKDIANSYSGAMKNVMAISGGQRGAALANIGAVDSTRVNALVDLASKSADMRQKNLDLYSKTAAAYSSQKLNADMTHEQLKQKVEMNRKNNLRAIGLNLFKEATEFSRNYMDISGIEGSSNQTSIIPEDNISSEVVSDELSDNLGFTN